MNVHKKIKQKMGLVKEAKEGTRTIEVPPTLSANWQAIGTNLKQAQITVKLLNDQLQAAAVAFAAAHGVEPGTPLSLSEDFTRLIVVEESEEKAEQE